MAMRDETFPAGDDAAARLSHLEHYWRSLALRGLPPSREEIEPDRIGAALPGAFVLDRIAPGQARLRVAGRALCEIVGTGTRGLPLPRLFRRADHMQLAALLERCLAELHPCQVPLLAEGAFRSGPIGGLALLPLRHRLGAAPQMIGRCCMICRRGERVAWVLQGLRGSLRRRRRRAARSHICGSSCRTRTAIPTAEPLAFSQEKGEP